MNKKSLITCKGGSGLTTWTPVSLQHAAPFDGGDELGWGRGGTCINNRGDNRGGRGGDSRNDRGGCRGWLRKHTSTVDQVLPSSARRAGGGPTAGQTVGTAWGALLIRESGEQASSGDRSARRRNKSSRGANSTRGTNSCS